MKCYNILDLFYWLMWLDVIWIIASVGYLIVIGYENLAGMLFVENILWYMWKMKWHICGLLMLGVEDGT